MRSGRRPSHDRPRWGGRRPVGGVRRDARSHRRLAKTHGRRLHGHRLHHELLFDARLLAGHDPAHHLRRRPGLVPGRRDNESASTATGFGKLLDQTEHMVLPAVTLTLADLGEYAIVMRSSLLDTMREDYLLLARAKGLRDVMVRNRHAVPNALLPWSRGGDQLRLR